MKYENLTASNAEGNSVYFAVESSWLDNFAAKYMKEHFGVSPQENCGFAEKLDSGMILREAIKAKALLFVIDGDADEMLLCSEEKRDEYVALIEAISSRFHNNGLEDASRDLDCAFAL